MSSGSDDESDGEDFPVRKLRNSSDTTAMLDTWLAELDSLNTEMDGVGVDPFRFSQATLEETQEDELNAILGELSALQLSLSSSSKINSQNSNENSKPPHQPPSFQVTKAMSTTSDNGGRTESPDNDSGFSDNASLLSSGSSLSASGSSSGSSTTSSLFTTTQSSQQIQTNNLPSSNHSSSSSSHDEKAEKIRVALAKMRAASIMRLYVKAFSTDGSSKALMVEESMSTFRVLSLLADKNHVPLSPKWSLVEHLPHLHMERIYEDHENMVENLLMWTRDSQNKIYFIERDEKYAMFTSPSKYLKCGENVEEILRSGSLTLPPLDSLLYLKAEGKKAWKKFHFVLRASGIYYSSKPLKAHIATKDLVCLTTIDHQQIYEGVGWKKKFKAPTEFGFALKPGRLQAKSHRHIKYLCAEDQETLKQWVIGLRMAKHGKVLWENYKSLEEEMAHEDLDRFGRSVSLSSMPIQITTLPSTTNQNPPITNNKLANERSESIPPPLSLIGTQCSFESEGNMDYKIGTIRKFSLDSNSSKNTTSSTESPMLRCGEEGGFESDCPMGGTIKRKPSSVLSPKIPLTLSTRSLVSEYMLPSDSSSLTLTLTRKKNRTQLPTIPKSPPPQNYEELPPPPPELLTNDPKQEFSHSNQSLTSSITSSPHSISNHIISNSSKTPPLNSILNTSKTPPPPPPPPILKTHSIGSYASSKGSVCSSSPRKIKGVTFATELSERLNCRNSSNSSSVSSVSLGGEDDFLVDLQRVMEKKWQVAEKCRVDLNLCPGEVLGFRTERVEEGGALNNVRAWVSQHYGPNNTNPVSPPPPNPKPIAKPQHFSNLENGVVIYENFQGEKMRGKDFGGYCSNGSVELRNKKPPPPIPKRADSTHLSAHFVYN